MHKPWAFSVVPFLQRMRNIQGTANLERLDRIEELVLDVHVGVELLAEFSFTLDRTGLHEIADYFGSGRNLILIWTKFDFSLPHESRCQKASPTPK
jgi:hypothetical protein